MTKLYNEPKKIEFKSVISKSEYSSNKLIDAIADILNAKKRKSEIIPVFDKIGNLKGFKDQNEEDINYD